jgi:hypothetical protein
MEILAHYTHKSWSRLIISDTTNNSVERLGLGIIAHVLFLFPKPELKFWLTKTLQHWWGIEERKEQTFTSPVDFEREKVRILAWAQLFAQENGYDPVPGLSSTSK